MGWVIFFMILWGYPCMSGYVYVSQQRRFPKKSSYDDNEILWVMSAMFWPVALPMMVGAWVAHRPERQAAQIEVQGRRIKELERELLHL